MTTPRCIVVLRALDLGDMLCAVPALRALRRRYPMARTTLVGLPWAASFAQRFRHLIDEFVEFPGHPGLPERAVEPGAWEEFEARMRARRFDLAVQLHGSGEVTNGIVAAFGAREVAGLCRGESPPGRFATWVDHLHEVEQCLRVVDALGLPRAGNYLEFPRTADDGAEFEALRGRFPALAGPYAVLHPGAKWASRRWPPERFARVADELAQLGLGVALTGVAGERPIAAAVERCATGPLANLAGETTLGGFAEVLRNAQLVVTNDTGASHVAAAAGTPSVVVSLGSDTARWAPLDAERHVTLAMDVPCRPCAFERCPYAHECSAISPSDVLEAAGRLLRRSSPVSSVR